MLAAVALAACVVATEGSAQDLLRVGNSAPTAFSFVWVKLGDQAGIYAKHGIKLEHFGFPGGGRVDSGLISGDIDIGLNSGAALASVAKGVPARAIAVTASTPSFTTPTRLSAIPGSSSSLTTRPRRRRLIAVRK